MTAFTLEQLLITSADSEVDWELKEQRKSSVLVTVSQFLENGGFDTWTNTKTFYDPDPIPTGAVVLGDTDSRKYSLRSGGDYENDPEADTYDANGLGTDWLDIYTASSLTVGDVMTYVTSGTQIESGTRYISKATGLTHTLPAKSGLAAGDTFILTNQFAGTVTLNLASADGSAEIWTGYAKKDYVVIVYNGTDFDVVDEEATLQGYLAKTADQSVAATTWTKGYAASYSVEEDTAGIFDSATNHRLDIPYAMELMVSDQSVMEGRYQHTIYINGTAVFGENYSGTQNIDVGFVRHTVAASDYIEPYYYNYNAGAVNLIGDAAKDESKFFWYMSKRIR